MPDRRHHYTEVKRKLIGTALLEELPLKEHAGPLAELNDGACHAFLPERKMRRDVEGYRVEVGDMANFVRPLGPCVLTGHDIAAQVDGYGVRAVHAALLAKGLDGPPALDRGVELVDALAEAEGRGRLGPSD
jgi:hypothetical protein